ncbi:MAG TPA: dihydrolipoyllysine-residue acetyltransferase [Steroidobacteraceae bacterium]|nr:dihydrolipoyllysine-residue acetyltransferase [Steroidobacteraceae bacterium]
MAQSIEVRLPDMGNFDEVGVIDVLVKPGDRVELETPLVTLETEKATMDVPSTAAGVIEAVHVQKGGKVSAGALIVTVRGEGTAAAPATAPTAAKTQPTPAAAAAPSAAAPAPAAPVKAAAATTQSIDVLVPDMGNFGEVGVIDILVKPGDAVEIDTPLVTLETEKATMDVPSSAAGIIEKVHVEKGGKISAGGRVVTLRGQVAAAPAVAAAVPAPAAATAPAAAAAVPVPAPAAPAGQPALGTINEAGFSKAHAGPSVRKLARELGVDLGRVTGTAPRGRISHDDVKLYVKQALAGALSSRTGGGGTGLPAVHVVDFAKFGPVEIKPLGRIQKISAGRLHASWVNLPHVTQFDEADITELEDARNKLKTKAAAEGIKLTPLAFIVRACVRTLLEYPTFCASLDASGDNVVMKKYMHIGFAADTPNGLLVPVIRDADKMDVYEIARALADLSDKARKGKLSGSEMQGGCFTISSLGGIGGTAFTPIINAPEVAILGVSRASMKPVWKDGAFVPRQMLPLSLSYDHRLIDGANGARFTTFLAKTLSDPRALLEAIP